MTLTLCTCGNEKEIRISHVKHGAIRSCGCLSRAESAKRCVLRTTHGHSSGAKSPTYRSYRSMRQRCENSTHEAYADYGGRGIAVCESWKTFVVFLADMGERPDGLTLDRIDNNGNYEPGNCRWATKRAEPQSSLERRYRRSSAAVKESGVKRTSQMSEIESARIRGRELDAIDRSSGFATPKDTPGALIPTAMSALECALTTRDWSCVVDAYVLLEEILKGARA